MKNNKKLKFGIVGCGRIANRHAENIKLYADLTGVCDIKKDRAKEFGDIYNVNSFLSIDEMLEEEKDIDIVSICTPNGLHAEHSIKALKAGKHVLCEKPMALTVKDCEKMIETAEDNNKRLFIVKQNRFNPPIKILKKILEERKLGKILSVQLNCFWNRNNDYYISSDWKGTKRYDGGTLFTQFSHFIDLLYWMVGDIKNVCAYTDNKNHENVIEFEDTGVVIIKFDNGVLGSINYTVNSFSKNMEGSITVFGEFGTVKVGGQYLNILEYQQIKDYIIDNIPDSSPANDYGTYLGSMSNHDKVYANVIDVLENNSRITTSFLDGLKTVQIIESIYNNIK